MRTQPTTIDLFCGIGGLTLGLKRAGVRCLGGVDSWSDAAATFEHNHADERCLVADLSELSPLDLCGEFGVSRRQIDFLVGGPPCQGFSTVGKRDVSDPRNILWRHYLNLVEAIRPAYVLIENVEGLVVMDRGGVCDAIVDGFNVVGYDADWRLLRASDYGVPQLRKRVFFWLTYEVW